MKTSAFLVTLGAIPLACTVTANLVERQQSPIVSKDNSLIPGIPSTGLGLWNSKDKDATKAVKSAFKTGYHHLDSAAAYFNEEYVGAALEQSSAPERSSYWITSKLWNTMHKPSNVPKALNKTLSDLGQDYLDLYLMHWPVAQLPGQGGRNILDQDTTIVDTWKAMEKLVAKNATHPEKGTTRFIGVSNFSPRQLDKILDICTICPYAHEFETHPYLQQTEFVEWHHRHDIVVIAYSPLANMNPTYKDKFPDLPKIIEDPFWTDLAAKKNATPAQAILAWGIARNTVVIPKSVHKKYIKENFAATHVKFSDEEMLEIAKRDRRTRFNNPSKDWGVEDLFEGMDGA